MRVVWLDEGFVREADARLPIDDPGVRWGEGLFETMRAEGGRVALLDRHLDRLEASARALGWGPMPGRDRMAAAAATVAEALAPGSGRVRLSATARPTLLVEGTAEPPLGRAPAAARAVAVRGAWIPEATLAEHKTLSYGAFRSAQRSAERQGAEHALLLDAAGRARRGRHGERPVRRRRAPRVRAGPRPAAGHRPRRRAGGAPGATRSRWTRRPGGARTRSSSPTPCAARWRSSPSTAPRWATAPRGRGPGGCTRCCGPPCGVASRRPPAAGASASRWRRGAPAGAWP